MAEKKPSGCGGCVLVLLCLGGLSLLVIVGIGLVNGDTNSTDNTPAATVDRQRPLGDDLNNLCSDPGNETGTVPCFQIDTEEEFLNRACEGRTTGGYFCWAMVLPTVRVASYDPVREYVFAKCEIPQDDDEEAFFSAVLVNEIEAELQRVNPLPAGNQLSRIGYRCFSSLEPQLVSTEG